MNRQVFSCPQHQDEVITNFCCLTNCLTPLCPDCIDNHIKNHKMKSQVPEVDTLSRVKKMCNNKISFTILALQENLQRLRNTNNLKPIDVLQDSLQDLEKLRQKMIEQINQYFNSLKEDFSKQFHQSASQFNGFQDLENKLQQVIEELQDIHQSLDTSLLFESIKTTTNLDSDSLIKSYDDQVNDCINKQIQLPIQIIFSEANFQSFQMELRKVVSIGSKEVKVVTNEKYLNMIAPRRDN